MPQANLFSGSSGSDLPNRQLRAFLARWAAEVCYEATAASLLVMFPDDDDCPCASETTIKVAVDRTWVKWPGRARAAQLQGIVRELLLQIHPDAASADMILFFGKRIVGMVPLIGPVLPTSH